MAVQKPKQQQNRKRTVTLEDEVLSLASAPMTKTVRAKKVAAKKPVAKKVTAKKAVKKTASRRTPAKTATVTMKRELLQVETAAKQIVHSPAMHRITRLGELYVLATVVTVFIVVALAWSQAILALGM